MSLDDKYTYPNSGGVLRNKLNITDGARLDEAMNELASAMMAALSIEETPEVFDFAYLQHIHSMMFQDLFTWAGQIRDVNTGAGDTTIVYARPAFIAQGLEEMFGKLAKDKTLFATDDPAEFAKRLADHWGYLSLIHPFRDGNTRSQSFFVLVLAEAAGHPIDWNLVPVDELRDARLRAMQGDERLLAGLLLRSITGDAVDEPRDLPAFRAGPSTTSGVAAHAPEQRCGKPRLHGRGACRRKLGDSGCPYHG